MDQKWDEGRNKCPTGNDKCLHSFGLMPFELRKMNSDLFTSITFVREPMDRKQFSPSSRVTAGNFGQN